MRLPKIRIAAVILTSLFSMVAQAGPLQVALEAGSAAGTVQVSLTNAGTSTLSVLRWDTPFEEILSSDVFSLERPRKGWPPVDRAVYVGREVKRGEPAQDQYLVLEPGKTISRSVELNDYYHIDKADSRTVHFAGKFRYNELHTSLQNPAVRKVLTPSALNVTAIESNSVQVSVSPDLSLRVLAPAYNNCSIQQETDIVSAAELAQNYVTTGIADLQSLAANERSGSPRYTTWFGAYTETRFNSVLANYQAIGAALENEQIRFDCGCDEIGVYAYVYPNKPYDIFLCPAFRAANVGGTDSRAGTIVHELSHFTILADTDDHVYSQRGAQSLASTDPAQAISNADSHEYFAENTPELSISSATNSPGPLKHEELALDTPVSDSVDLEGSVTYQVSDASQISLSSLSGDADLSIYSDSALTAEICNSSSASGLDVCEIFAQGTVYIRVFGYTTASFTIEASAGDTTTPSASTITTLSLGNVVFGTLDEDERVAYQVSGAELIELESLSGDANLYVFDSTEFLDTTLICVSNLLSSESTTDSCILPSDVATYYLLVVGYTASDFSLIAVASSNEPTTGPESVNMGRMVISETVSDSVAAGQFHYFVLSDASSVQLTSLSGDADLSVYSTPDHEFEELVCSSALYTAESVTDACDIPSGDDYYITVFGYEEASYTLAASALPEDDDPAPELPVTDVPVTDVPVTEVPDTEVPDTEIPTSPQTPDASQTPVDGTPAVSSGGSGGGSLNFWVFSLLMLTVAYRRSAASKR